MFVINKPRNVQHLRRLALAAQGLLLVRPFGNGLAGTRQAINHIGYVQIDTISVIERAHHHVLFSRVPNFKPSMIEQLLQKGEIFEYWSHAAAFLPTSEYRFSLPYKNAIKSGQTHWFKTRDEKLMAELMTRIVMDGPLRSRDVENKAKKGAGWWDWKPAKKALEQLYMQGDLMVSSREGFQKTYDLTERVLPPQTNTKVPDMVEFATHLLEQQLRCHGFVSLKGLTYLRRNAELRQSMKSLVKERLTDQRLEQIQLPGGEIFLIPAGELERKPPHLNNRLLILSPFDNSVIQRERLKVVFNFEYQIECYVPAAKRQYGYFCLPLLFRDQFIGRMDCKAYRKNRHFEIKGLHFEQNDFDQELVISAFVTAINTLIKFQNCDSVSLTEVNPPYLASIIRSRLN